MQNLNEHINRMRQLIGAKHGIIKPLVSEQEGDEFDNLLINKPSSGGKIQSSVDTKNNFQKNVKWSFKVEKVPSSVNEVFIVGTATLDEGYHIFSVNHDPIDADMTGIPTKFEFKTSNFYKVVGPLEDVGNPETITNEYGTQLYFENTASFKQKIKVLTKEQFDISFSYEYQICNDDGCQFPPAQNETLTLNG